MSALARISLREIASSSSSSRAAINHGSAAFHPRALRPSTIIDQRRHRSSKSKPATAPPAKRLRPGKGSQVDSKTRYNYNTALTFEEEPDPDHVSYRRVTAAELVNYRQPPTRVKMLVRDFIDDSLYNPHYGYFSKNVTIFTPPNQEGYDFKSFPDEAAFQEAVAERYAAEYGGQSGEGLGRQVWHTPTELFKPHYARSLASAILSQYKLNHFPHEDLVIYEVGAGNGSFMVDTLRFLRDEHPEIFARTKYRIIEISGALAKIQVERAVAENFTNVEVINEDVFKWEGGNAEPCFVVALEVFDNFSHDMVRYDMATLQPKQAIVAIDKTGDFTLMYEQLTDPLLRRVMAYRRILPPGPTTEAPLSKPLLASQALRTLYTQMPFAPNLSGADFIPSKAVSFLERLREQLPNHRLLVADFNELPEAVPGRNGPVVQTRYAGRMVPCETFLVKQGYFDIFFPTDFELLRDTYSLIMNSPSRRDEPNTQTRTTKLANDFFSATTVSPSTGVKGFRRRSIGVYTQADFVAKFGGKEVIEATSTRDGMSTMLNMYRNAKVLF